MSELFQRVDELRDLGRLVTALGEGEPVAAVVEGPAGIGKTALVEEAASRARAGGVLVLSARAHELEQQLPYGVLVQLLSAHVRAMPADDPALEGPARHLLRLLGHPRALGGQASELDVLEGLRWLCADLSERRPLLLVVDDLPWSDPESLRALHYLLRRVEGFPVGLLATARSGEAPRPVASAVLAACELAVRPRQLSSAGVEQALLSWWGRQPTDRFVTACLAASGGNPLFLKELTRALLSEGARPDDEGAARVVGFEVPNVTAAVLQRVQRLPEEALALAQAFAVLARPAPVQLAARLVGLEPARAVSVGLQLVAADVLTDSSTPELVHPLLSTSLYESLSPLRRADLHRAAVPLLRASGADDEELARHVLAAPPLPDDGWFELLVSAAGSSAARGAPGAAVRFLRRALELQPRHPDRWEVTYRLGTLETDLADSAGEGRLLAVVGSDAPVTLRALAALRLADQLTFAGRALELTAVLDDALLAQVGAHDPDLSRRLLAAGLPARYFAGSPGPSAVELAEVAEPTLGHRDLLAAMAVAAPDAPTVIALSERALLGAEALPEEFVRSAAYFFAVSRLVYCDRLELAEQLLATATHVARRHGSLFELGRCHYLRAVIASRRGDLPEAVAQAELGLDLVGAEGRAMWGLGRAATTVLLVESLVQRGDVARAEALLAEWPAEQAPSHVGSLIMRASQARLDLARGRVDEAVAGLEDLERAAALRSVEMMYLRVRPQLAGLLAAGGQQGRARAVAERALEDARSWGLERSLAQATLAHGLVVGGDTGVELLREAVSLAAATPGRYDEATALVELGTALRRAKRLREAREPLTTGMHLAASCGAAPLVERAAQELRAAGARPRRVGLTGAAALTTSELRVARLAADGAANREIAQALFLSRKTVEKHLASAYGKLGIASRAGLTDALSGEGAPAGSASTAP